MDYLPHDPNESDIKNKDKTDRKLKEFREYIVEKGIVLAFVKVLLSLKYSENKPKNPIKAIREFFGQYHDPKWDEMEALKEKIIMYNIENPKLLEKAIELEDQLEKMKRNMRFKNLFKAYEWDKNGMIGTKLIIEKLTGNKKFEVEEKLGLPEFTKLIENIGGSNPETESILLEKLEKSTQGVQSFKDDMDNPLYKRMVACIKELKKAAVPTKK